MIIRQVGNEYSLEFAYDRQMVESLKKRLPHRRFDYPSKRWFIPLSDKDLLADFARRWGYQMNVEPQMTYDFTIQPLPEMQITIPLKGTPYPYQGPGIQRAYDLKRCIIGDKPGLGKTLQSIAAVLAHDAFPCLVICPDDPGPTNWEREWAKWTDKRARVLTPSLVRYMSRWIETDMIHVFVVGYSSLKKYFVEEIDKTKGKKVSIKDITFNGRKDIFKSVIVDEIHFCANFSTLRSKIVKGICDGKEIIYGLTGTSYVNANTDIAPQLSIINRLDDIRDLAREMGILPKEQKATGWGFFKWRYCAGDERTSRTEELNYMLTQTCYFSRNKEDVLTDLPPKVRQTIYCDLDEAHRVEYEQAEADLENYLRQYKEATDEDINRSLRGAAMVRIGICKNIAARGKLSGVKHFIRNAINEGQKMVVFLHQHEVLHAMLQEFPDALTLTGLDDKANRMPAVDAFQNDPTKMLILVSMKVGGQLITLTASSHVGFIEMGWNPATHDQCEDRCHRIGQKDSVMSSWFIARNTIDEWNLNLIETKRKHSDSVTGGVSGDVERDIIDSIADAILNRKKQEVENE